MNYSTLQPLFISADWLLDGLGNAVKDGAVLVDQGKIVKVTQWQPHCHSGALPAGVSAANHKHFAGGVITPGLFNLHTHIDYTLAAPVYSNAPEAHMFDWLRTLVTMARSWDGNQFVASAQAGARALALSGVSYTVDSSFSGQAAHALVAAGLKGTVGLELFGVDKDRAEIAFAHWLKRYHELVETKEIADAISKNQLTVTVSPHAPYTVSPSLWQKARQWAAQRQLKVLAHLAESSLESSWLGASEPSVDQYLEFVLPPNPDKATSTTLQSIDWKGHGDSPVAHLQRHDLLDSNLIAAHCLHFDQTDYQDFARAGAKAALCPRSNQRLGNGRPSLKDFKRHGIAFGLGTDSLASSPDLSTRQEAGDLWRQELTSDYRELLSIITSQSAAIMGVADHTGSLAPNLAADICVFIGQTNTSEDSAYRAVFEPATALDTLLVNGQTVVSSGQYQAIQAK